MGTDDDEYEGIGVDVDECKEGMGDGDDERKEGTCIGDDERETDIGTDKGPGIDYQVNSLAL
jgi:hypothetical protein